MKCKVCDIQYNDYAVSGPWRKGGLCKECKSKVEININTQGGKFSSKQLGVGRAPQ